MKKKYFIDNKEFRLIEYSELSIENEEIINIALGLKEINQKEISTNFNPETILSLILIGEKEGTNFRKVTYKTYLDIISDFLINRVNFFHQLPTSIEKIIDKKAKDLNKTS